MADQVTKEQIEVAEADFQAKVEAHAVAATEYNAVVEPFISKRRTLRDAYAAEVEADKVLTDLVTQYQAQPVPPVPTDE